MNSASSDVCSGIRILDFGEMSGGKKLTASSCWTPRPVVRVREGQSPWRVVVWVLPVPAGHPEPLEHCLPPHTQTPSHCSYLQVSTGWVGGSSAQSSSAGFSHYDSPNNNPVGCLHVPSCLGCHQFSLLQQNPTIPSQRLQFPLQSDLCVS